MFSFHPLTGHALEFFSEEDVRKATVVCMCGKTIPLMQAMVTKFFETEKGEFTFYATCGVECWYIHTQYGETQ